MPTIFPRRVRRLLPMMMTVLIAAVVLAACDSNGEEGAQENGVLEAGSDRSLEFDGPEEDLLNAEALSAATFTVAATGDDAHLDDIVLLFDGQDVTADAEASGTTLTYSPGELEDGEYLVSVVRTVESDGTEDAEAAEPADDEQEQEPDTLHEWAFAVDATPPEIEITSPESAVVAGEAVTIAGNTEPGATVEIGDNSATAGEDGSFEIELPEAPEGTITVLATDEAGNTSSEDDLRLMTVPSRVSLGEYRSAHVTGCAWGYSPLRDPIMQMVEEGRLNAVQLDLKDESGIVNFDYDGPLSDELMPLMTAGCSYDLEEAVATLHDLGIPVIGRIVAFRDPVLVGWAWDNDRRDYAVQTPGGDRLPLYGGGMANFANEDVVEYNIAIAEQAAAAGVDHILWDYIRRPEGSLDAIVFPDLETTVEESIVDFTRVADEALSPYGIEHGASVYGIAATRPQEIGQDIPAMSEHLDYVAPMIYPDHWGAGEFGLANPNSAPYEIVFESLKTFEEATEGRRARVVPWLGDFGSGSMDNETYIREQVRATFDNDVQEFILWNAGASYTTSAYDVID